MPERTSITQVIQIGVESTSGVAVAATKKLQSISIDPGVKVNINAFRPQWDKYNTTLALGKEWVEASISGDPNYNELPYLLSSVLTTAVVVQGATTETPSYTWTFSPSSTAPDAPKTFTVEHGSSVRADKFSFGLVTAFNFAVDRSKFTISGSMMGQQLVDAITLTPAVNDIKNLHASAVITGGTFTVTDGAGNVSPSITGATATAATVNTAFAAATPNPIDYTAVGGNLGIGPVDIVCTANGPGARPGWTITPTAITGGTITVVQGTAGSGPSTVPLVPAIPPQVDVYLDTTYAAIGSTKLTRALGANFSLDSRFGPLWALNSAVSSWTAAVETAPKAEIKLMLEADSQGMAFLTQLRNSATLYCRIVATGGIIPGCVSTHFKWQVDAAVKVKDISPFRDDQGVYAVDFTFDVVDDPSGFGGAFRMILVNALSAL